MAEDRVRRGQLNVRLNDQGKARLYGLVERMRAVLGMPNLSQADVLHAALAELERRYPEGCEAGTAPPLPVERTRRGPAPMKPAQEKRPRRPRKAM